MPGKELRLDLVDFQGQKIFSERLVSSTSSGSFLKKKLVLWSDLWFRYKAKVSYGAYILKWLILDEIRRMRARYPASGVKRRGSYSKFFLRPVLRLLRNLLFFLRKAKRIQGRFSEIVRFSKTVPHFQFLMKKAVALNRGAVLIVHNKMQATYIQSKCCDRTPLHLEVGGGGTFLEVVAVDDCQALLGRADEVDYYFTESAYAKFCQTKRVDVESATV
jgi:hypothetical protein